jgi:PAS domain S-box-containing protein
LASFEIVVPSELRCHSIERLKEAEMSMAQDVREGGLEVREANHRVINVLATLRAIFRREVLKVHGHLADIDDSRRADDSTHESERTLRLLVDSVPALVWRFDAGGTFEFLNQRAARHTGLVPGDPPSKFRALIHPDDVEMTARAWDLARTKDEPFSVTHRLLGPCGSYRWFEVRGEPIHDRDGKAEHWCGFAVDVDESVRMSEQLKANQAATERASRMATLAELSASIAHEINQPLAAIANNGAACNHWLGIEPPNMPRARQAMERIVRDALSVSEVVSRVRALYRYGPLLRAELDLNVVVRETQALVLSECTRARVRMELDLAPELPHVNADRVQIQQVLINLVGNAIDAMKAGTQQHRRIVLRTRLGAGEEDAYIEVTDTGPGLADGQRAFEAFYTTKEHGMGMGLAICRRIAETHGGRIVARNLKPHGASLALFLPVVPHRIAEEEPRGLAQ